MAPARPSSPSFAPQLAACGWRAGVCLFCVLIASVPAQLFAVRRTPHKAVPKETPWEHAESVHAKLEAQPEKQRTKVQYETALDAYRVIYHDEPTSSKAPAAVAAVADLLTEKGRIFKDSKALKAAIGQYEFLREQYPHSPPAKDALLSEGDLCRNDLKDSDCAHEKFHAVLNESPGTSYAEQAAMELREMDAPKAAPKAEAASKRGSGRRAQSSSTETARIEAPKAELPIPPPPVPATQAKSDPPQEDTIQPERVPTSHAISGPHKVVQITGMRHWSNPTSTRIAIDLGGQVEYEAARVPNPDRIFFDLHGARLASSLNGRQVEVIDDGYLKRIRAAQFQPDVTRVVLDVTDVSEYSAFLLPNPWRLIIDIHSEKGGKAKDTGTQIATIGPTKTPAQQNSESTLAEVAKLSNDSGKVVATAGPTSGPVSAKVPGTTPATDTPASAQSHPAPVNPTVSAAPVANTDANSAKNKHRGRSKSDAKTDGKSEVADAVPHAADPDSDGQRSLVRALGLKVGRIVIDAGHGGHDSGTLGPGGIQEKDVVLDVALRVGKLLHQRLGAEIVYTRDDDTFIPLETRTAIANKAQADLFLSIHANSSSDAEARGVEAYYLNFTSDPGALDVAARENAVSTQSVHQLSDLVRKITLKDKIDESREFAADVDAGLYAGLKSGNPGLKDRGVKKAPFVVLIGAQMPSILAEISFLTNPDDADQLRQGNYRERIAEALDSGVEKYLRGLSGLRPDVRNPARGAMRSAERIADAQAGGTGR